MEASVREFPWALATSMLVSSSLLGAAPWLVVYAIARRDRARWTLAKVAES
ncbi:MAG: hypothetical protein U0169_04410 [Polyangiaceae bacterium]